MVNNKVEAIWCPSSKSHHCLSKDPSFLKWRCCFPLWHQTILTKSCDLYHLLLEKKTLSIWFKLPIFIIRAHLTILDVYLIVTMLTKLYFFSERTHDKAFFGVKSNTKWKLLQIIFHGYKYYLLVTGHTSNFVVVCILWFCFLAPNYRTGRYLDRSVDCRSTLGLNYFGNI